MTAIPGDLPRLLAEDACAVFWWAFRMRMPRAQQIEEVEKAMRKRLEELNPDPLIREATAGASAHPAPMQTAQKHEGILAPVGQDGRKAGHSRVKWEQQDAANQWVGNKPEVGGTDTATNSQIGEHFGREIETVSVEAKPGRDRSSQQEPYAYGSGEAQDRCVSASPSNSQIEPGVKADPATAAVRLDHARAH